MSIESAMLRNVPLFKLLDDDELAELAAHIDERKYSPQQIIFNAGDPGNNMQIILDGKVETFITDDEGNKVVLSELEKGELFGELSLLDSEPRSASAIATDPTTTFVIDRDDLKRLVTKKPESALDIMAILGERIRKTDFLLKSRFTRNPNQVLEQEMTFGERVADQVARFGGSWKFIGSFASVLIIWILINSVILHTPYDPYPFILLNLFLSMLAAIQAPVILMSQNRADTKDRVRSELDYQVNVKAEVEISQLQKRMDELYAIVVKDPNHASVKQ